MNYILDTHAFLWYCSGDTRLTQSSKDIIENTANEIFLSVASVWEMAIKISLTKLKIKQPFDVFIFEQMNINGFILLPIDIEHTFVVTSLPFYHRDPFDRLLIAQSINEKFPIISKDITYDQYSITRMW